MEKIRVDEVSKIISEKIKNFDQKVEMSETGTVLSVGDGIARVYGLEQVMAGELVEFESGVKGVVLNLEEDNVGVALFGSSVDIKANIKSAVAGNPKDSLVSSSPTSELE